MVQKLSDSEKKTEGLDEKEGAAQSAVGGTVGHLPRQTPTGSSDGVDEEVSTFTSVLSCQLGFRTGKPKPKHCSV